MSTDGPGPASRHSSAALLAVVILLFPLGYSIASALVAGTGGDRQPLLELPEGEVRRCLRPLEYMRFRHMDLLTEMRDAGVRGGARRAVSFADCTSCHRSRDTFCNRCHEAVNLTPDCFQCHYYPSVEGAAQ